MADGAIFHIATPEQASRLRSDGRLEPPSLTSEGFVHCSTADEVVASTERHFDAEAELMLIELDPARLVDEVRWPEVYPGRRFPHLFGAVPVDAVVEVHPWGRSDRERWSARLEG